jgi:hypothetical protein
VQLFHPLLLSSQFGNLERAMLRRGKHASAKFWRRVPRWLFAAILDRIALLAIPPPSEYGCMN